MRQMQYQWLQKIAKGLRTATSFAIVVGAYRGHLGHNEGNDGFRGTVVSHGTEDMGPSGSSGFV